MDVAAGCTGRWARAARLVSNAQAPLAKARPARGRWTPALLAAIAAVASGTLPLPAAADDSGARNVGLAQVFAAPHAGALSTPPVTPEAFGRTAEMHARAAPTNQWFSSLLFGRWSQVLHAHPATYLAGADGFEIGYPHQTTVDAGGRGKDIAYPHHAALTLIPTGFQALDARLAGQGDFSVTVRMGDASGQALSATLLHGSPFSYYTLSSGGVRVKLAAGAHRCATAVPAQELCVEALDRQFALFAPPDAHWNAADSGEPVLEFGASGRFLSVALLPDALPATLAEFRRHAYAFVTDTRVDWHYDPATSQVETRFSATVEPRVAGADTALLGLYPHQERALVDVPAQRFRFDSVRGAILTVSRNSFRTVYTWHGILPFWPGLEDPADRQRLASVLNGDAARSRNLFSVQMGRGTYWYGKALSAVAQLMDIAEQEGDASMRDAQLASLRQRMETWFGGSNRASYFVQDARLGTVVGYPDEYGSVTHMNDHHFHYGYWINAAAQVALRDRDWADPAHWGGMVDLLVRDVGTAERGRADFPFLRNFDAYEGHSWASGDAVSSDGNNQESSSEAVNAWAGLVLWGEATGNRALRDQGIWMYTLETEAIRNYWFDAGGVLFPPEYGGRAVAAQVFGGRYAYNTWWTEEPRQIQGINLIPITPASVYLAYGPDYIHRFNAALAPEVKAYRARGMSDGTPDDVWQDLHASFLALADPPAALAQWKPRGSTELGETRSHTLFWLLSLKEMGPPDLTVTADTALYGVFRTPGGARTYLAYNPMDTPIEVRFSDGQPLAVPAHSLARVHGSTIP
ncbi:MAG: hypothetical protein KGI67_02630 [Pseudomonadota bacterium]|nr:hypothetical protein [Pseudomonadota bacterium]